MVQLLVKCKNCGFELTATTQMNEEAFEAISINNSNETCPECERTFAYNKSDYYFRESHKG
jgi:hypothetical protein